MTFRTKVLFLLKVVRVIKCSPVINMKISAKTIMPLWINYDHRHWKICETVKPWWQTIITMTDKHLSAGRLCIWKEKRNVNKKQACVSNRLSKYLRRHKPFKKMALYQKHSQLLAQLKDEIWVSTQLSIEHISQLRTYQSAKKWSQISGLRIWTYSSSNSGLSWN